MTTLHRNLLDSGARARELLLGLIAAADHGGSYNRAQDLIKLLEVQYQLAARLTRP